MPETTATTTPADTPESPRRVRVYIAGPYTRGDVAVNVREAMLAWALLQAMGHAPLCPHWTHFQHLLTPLDYEDWLAFDLEWLPCCDVVLRLPGESAGADREVAEARRLGVPVVHDVEDLAALVSLKVFKEKLVHA
ncbi:MAG TPA: DUF4406 domain-containing protein [Gemmataceae bacterium]|nr:DUF4406 domain-containing protein [Gemmataceae bacterium]